MAALYDMTRRLTKHQINSFTKKMEEDELPTVTLGNIVVSHSCGITFINV